MPTPSEPNPMHDRVRAIRKLLATISKREKNSGKGWASHCQWLVRELYGWHALAAQAVGNAKHGTVAALKRDLEIMDESLQQSTGEFTLAGLLALSAGLPNSEKDSPIAGRIREVVNHRNAAVQGMRSMSDDLLTLADDPFHDPQANAEAMKKLGDGLRILAEACSV